MHWIDILVVVIALFVLIIAFSSRAPTTVNVPPDVLLHQKIDRLERQFDARRHVERIEGEMIQRIFERTKDGYVAVRGEIFLAQRGDTDGTTGNTPRE